jgi:hypothetical protein
MSDDLLVERRLKSDLDGIMAFSRERHHLKKGMSTAYQLESMFDDCIWIHYIVRKLLSPQVRTVRQLSNLKLRRSGISTASFSACTPSHTSLQSGCTV